MALVDGEWVGIWALCKGVERNTPLFLGAVYYLLCPDSSLHVFLLAAILPLDVAHGSLGEPPGNAGDGQAEEPLRDVDALDNDLGYHDGEDDGDGRPGDGAE